MRLRRLISSLLGVALCSAPVGSAAQSRIHLPVGDAGASVSATDTERPLELADLVHRAGTIFSGTVQRIESGSHDGVATPGAIWITFRVSRWLRGPQTPARFTLREWAGLWNGNGNAAPRYRVGESLVLFLHPESALGFSSPVGGSAGLIPVADDQTVALTPAIAEPIRARRLATASIRGSVYFSLPGGTAGQPMQGVNLVARLLDPVSGQPSGKAVRSGVSGFLFRGHAGNPVSSFVSPKNLRYDAFGGEDTSLEGYFELSGLELPLGYSQAQYQVTLEEVNPLYIGAQSVGSYHDGQVLPSGTLSSFTATVAAGAVVNP